MDIDPEVANLEPLPPITQRLRDLRPSQELLDFYRQKIAEFDGEHADLLARLDKFKGIFDDRHKMTWEVAQREEEVAELQKALSDMQVYLFQEREHVLRLYAENDRLKIQELEDRKKIQKLLGMTQPVEHETTYFQDPGHSHPIKPHESVAKLSGQVRAEREAASRRKQAAQGVTGAALSPGELDYKEQNETLLLTIEALKAQMEDQAKLAKEEVAALLEDRRVRAEEAKIAAQRDAEKIASLTEKMEQTQQLLYDTTKDFLELKYDHRQALRQSEEEKERLLKRMEELKDDIDQYQAEALAALKAKAVPIRRGGEIDREYRDMGTNAYRPGGRHDTSSASGKGGAAAGPGDAGAEGETSYSEGIEGATRGAYARQKAHMQETLAEMYREQCIQLEDELCRLREEREAAKSFQNDKAKSYAQRSKMWKSRYEALERRRALESEGYKTDISMLRKRLKEMEHQLYRLAVRVGEGENEDKMLLDVRKSAARSKHLVGELQLLKGKIHAMESDVRHLQTSSVGPH